MLRFYTPEPGKGIQGFFCQQENIGSSPGADVSGGRFSRAQEVRYQEIKDRDSESQLRNRPGKGLPKGRQVIIPECRRELKTLFIQAQEGKNRYYNEVRPGDQSEVAPYPPARPEKYASESTANAPEHNRVYDYEHGP